MGTASAPAPVGTITFFDTHIGAWEEKQPDAFVDSGVYERFRSLLARLRDHRGFRVWQDASVPKRIRRGYYFGRKGDLEFRAEAHGRMFSIVFFQNVANVENQYGGQHDYGKFARMPRTMQLACAVEMSHVLRKLGELGYTFSLRNGIASAGLFQTLRHARGLTCEGDPLAQFNRAWNFASDWKRGGRFERDESGWPKVSRAGCGWGDKDRDGLPLVSGETMYTRHKGRLYRGIARPAPNGQWILLSHGEGLYARSSELFRCEDTAAEPRRLVPGQLRRVRAELEKALKANAYPRIETLARIAKKLDAERAVGGHGVDDA